MTEFDAHGFYRQWPPRYTTDPLRVSFWNGVEMGWFGRERNPEIPQDPSDPDAHDLAYRHGLSVGRSLRQDYR